MLHYGDICHNVVMLAYIGRLPRYIKADECNNCYIELFMEHVLYIGIYY